MSVGENRSIVNHKVNVHAAASEFHQEKMKGVTTGIQESVWKRKTSEER